ncbi:Receptor-like protein 12 [Vitis vinifera]|uniref:Receptor-like protein 12 n=1 Tax=Vitis vinifera TaxID=29760 RepID=A0A438DPY4_VITVI|nr:Receptor-like protein 12 [Vitis vinifera]
MCLNFMEPVSKVVGLAGTSFSGQLPTSFINLNSEILPSLENLTQLNFLAQQFGKNTSYLINLTQLSSVKQQPEVWVLMESQKAQPWKISVNETVPNFEVLGLASCNLSKFPIIEIPWWTGSPKPSLSFPCCKSLKSPTMVLQAWKESLRMSLITAIEISSNKFSGEIQESIGNLKRLHLLNLFGNSFTGQIPSSLKNLEHLESLDLSHNKLPGEIPQQLTRIDTLDSEPSPPPLLISEQDEDSKYTIKVGLMLVSMEYGSELVVVVIRHTLTTRKYEQFVKTFSRRRKNQRRERKKGSRSFFDRQ